MLAGVLREADVRGRACRLRLSSLEALLAATASWESLVCNVNLRCIDDVQEPSPVAWCPSSVSRHPSARQLVHRVHLSMEGICMSWLCPSGPFGMEAGAERGPRCCGGAGPILAPDGPDALCAEGRAGPALGMSPEGVAACMAWRSPDCCFCSLPASMRWDSTCRTQRHL